MAAAGWILLAGGAATGRAEVILQYFNTSWGEISARIPEVAEAGYGALWLPPPAKGASGGFSVGYDPLDRFDLGDRDQSGTLPTKYGTRAELLRLVEVAHRFGLRVYFDNVMAHNGGPLGNTPTGTLIPGVPGFVPEDFHVGWNGSGWQKFADWPDWDDEWQVLHRNPFSWDIANEAGANASFDSDGMEEGSLYPKWVGVRQPGRTELYRDRDLVVGVNAMGELLHPFADNEPFEDVGLDGVPGTGDAGEGNGRFDWVDTDGDGQHTVGEPAEPFADVGVAADVPSRRVAAWGWGDGVYNMGDPVPEDVNEMLERATRWFMDVTYADGFRLDAVKLVPAGFFGIQSGPDKDISNAGMLGAAQEQYNLTRGFTDSNHRDSIFDEAKPRDDAMMWGEHINEPPAQAPYLDAGMRIGNEGMQHAVRSRIGSDLTGLDQRGFGHFHGNPVQSLGYVMSHDNSDMWGQDRPQGHAFLLLKEGLSVVYTDGYNESGPPDYFPAPAGNPFLGQFGAARTDAPSRFPWSEQDIAIAERMETVFRVPGFNADAATVYPHNDHGVVETGLREGLHVLRARPFVGRTDGSSIFNTWTQTFYYDTRRPTGAIAFPREGDVLTGAEYELVILADDTVTDVRVNIQDADPGNDFPAQGNGPDAWAPAARTVAGAYLRDSGWPQEWRFTYRNIPAEGSAVIRVRLREASSAEDDTLSDEDGWTTTLARTAATAGPLQWRIVAPEASAAVGQGDLLRVRIAASLVPAAMSDAAFLDEVSISIASRVSGSGEGAVPQPRSGYTLARNAGPNEHEVLMPLPNLFQGEPEFLHRIEARHERAGVLRADSLVVRARIADPTDADADGLPDVWESAFGLEPDNADWPHGGSHDLDGDGLDNYGEYVLRTDPGTPDAELRPRVTIQVLSHGQVRIRFPILAARNHTLFGSVDGSTWSPIMDPILGRTDGIHTLEMDADTPYTAFRASYQIGYP